MADTKLSNLPAIATGDIDNSVLIYCVDVTGGNISSKVTRSALYLDIANIFTKGQTLSSITTTGLIINPSSAPTGSSSEFIASLKLVSGTVAFGTTPQTGDYITNKIDQATLTNPSSGTVTNASSLKIVGPPVASTNVTITNAYSLWIASGTTLLQATTIATTLLVQGQTTHSTTTNTGIIINPPTAPTGSSSEFVGAINKNAGTIQFASTTQTGDFVSTKYGQDTLTNTSPGTITNASTLKITGAPIASTNVTITNNYALWVAGGNSLFAGTLTSTGGITMSGADITLGANKLKTSDFNVYEGGVIGQNGFNAIPSNAVGGVISVGTGANGVVALQLVSTTDITTNYEAFTIDDGITASNLWTISSVKGGTGTARNIAFVIAGTVILSLTSGGGIQVGAPTGGDKGAGTANFAGDIYKNNTAYTNPDYVFEHYYTGNIIKFASNEGAKDYKGLRTLSDLEDYVKQNHRFPNISDKPSGMFERGDKMLEISEQLTLYLFDHEKRLLLLEQKIRQ